MKQKHYEAKTKNGEIIPITVTPNRKTPSYTAIAKLGDKSIRVNITMDHNWDFGGIDENGNPENETSRTFLEYFNLTNIPKNIRIVVAAYGNKPSDVSAWARAEHKKWEAEIYKIDNITSYTYKVGCDSPSTSTIWYSEENPEVGTPLTRKMYLMVTKELATQLGAKELPSTWTTYGGWEFQGESARKLARLAQAEIEKAKKRETNKHKQSKQWVADCISKAKSTGKRVEIASTHADCYDPHEECSTDIITKWACPDGSIETTQMHTY